MRKQGVFKMLEYALVSIKNNINMVLTRTFIIYSIFSINTVFSDFWDSTSIEAPVTDQIFSGDDSINSPSEGLIQVESTTIESISFTSTIQNVTRENRVSDDSNNNSVEPGLSTVEFFTGCFS